MGPDEDELATWEARADASEADLAERVRLAISAALTPEEERAFAAERDKLATDRDALAAAYDVAAQDRDASGLERDAQGSTRDRGARRVDGDMDAGAVERFMAGRDRDLAAGDRSDAADDRRRGRATRRRAAEARQRAASDRAASAERIDALETQLVSLNQALDTRLVIGQAEGLLMAYYQLGPEAALKVLVKLSQESHIKLRDVAARLVLDASPPSSAS